MKGALVGAAIGTAVAPGIGTGIGAAVGGGSAAAAHGIGSVVIDALSRKDYVSERGKVNLPSNQEREHKESEKVKLSAAPQAGNNRNKGKKPEKISLTATKGKVDDSELSYSHCSGSLTEGTMTDMEMVLTPVSPSPSEKKAMQEWRKEGSARRSSRSSYSSRSSNQVSEREDAVQQLRQMVESMAAKIEALETNKVETDRKMEAMRQNHVAEIKALKEDHAAEIRANAAKMEAMEQNHRAEIADLKKSTNESVQLLQEQLNTVTAENKSLKSQLQDKDSQLHDKDSQLQASNKKIKELEAELETKRGSTSPNFFRNRKMSL